MKRVLERTEYSFDPTSQKVYFDMALRPVLRLGGILLITNITRSVMIFQFNEASLGGSYADGVLTLTYDTTAMAVTDDLQIVVDCPEPVIADTHLRDISNTLRHLLEEVKRINERLMKL